MSLTAIHCRAWQRGGGGIKEERGITCVEIKRELLGCDDTYGKGPDTTPGWLDARLTPMMRAVNSGVA